MPDIPFIWNEPFRVRAFEIGAHGRASALSMCNYFQEAAGNHAHALGVSIDQLTEYNQTWMLARLHVQIAAYPAWRDEIRLETWPAGIQGLYAIRDFLFYQNDRLIGRGTSAWLVLDMVRKRPVRVEPIVEHFQPPDRSRALEDGFEKLAVPDAADHERRFHVRYSDLDVNQHVNNVRYAEWAVESVPEDVLYAYDLSELNLHFRAETTLGDLVIAQAQRQEAGDAPTFHHRLLRSSDERDVAIAHTRWARRA